VGLRLRAKGDAVDPLGLIILIAVIYAARAGKAKTQPAAPVLTSRGSTTPSNDPHFGGTLVLQFLLGSICLGLLAAAIGGSLVAAVLAVVLSLFLFPWWWARCVCVPLGLARSAYALSMLSRVTWRRDKPGGPLLAAAWALSRQRRPNPKLVGEYQTTLEQQSHALQASSVVAQGLFAAMAGRSDEARRWMESVFWFDARIAVRPVRRIASEWLLADACARGEWARVVTLASARPAPWSPLLSLAQLIARRQLGEDVPTWRLWLAWALAPGRHRTFAFVQKMTQKVVTRRAAAGALVAEAAPATPPLRAAVDAQWCAQAAPGPDRMLAAARAWQHALADPLLRSRCVARLGELGGLGVPNAVEQLDAAVRAFLVPHAEACRKAAAHEPLPGVLEAALGSRKDALYAHLEDHLNRLSERRGGNRILPMIEEWRELASVRALYAELCEIGGADERRLAHAVLKDRLLNYGAWLFNQHRERPAANAIFRALEVEAEAVGDAKSTQVNRENAKCGL